jgi:hypothetical protein
MSASTPLLEPNRASRFISTRPNGCREHYDPVRGTRFAILAVASPLASRSNAMPVGSRDRARASLRAHSLIDCEPIGFRLKKPGPATVLVVG